MTRSYSNFGLPPLHVAETRVGDKPATLTEQAEGLAGLRVAVDAEPSEIRWRSMLPLLDEVVRLYSAGRTVNAIANELSIAWDSVAKLLERAGVRKRI